MMDARASRPGHLDQLNDAQRAAVLYGMEPSPHRAPPLLIIAGAGSGKTLTLAHRVGELIVRGVDPQRILLLTFSRRASVEMKRRAERIVSRALRQDVRGATRSGGSLQWAGTFHSVGNRLLRRHAIALGLEPSFTVLDRGDSEDLLNLVRSRLGLAAREKRFPQKGTCLAIYSRVVNAGESLPECLEQYFPWCRGWEADLRALFRAFVEVKHERSMLDYDDLLLYWHHMMDDAVLAADVASLFDHVLVDEYQDTNALQARILLALRPQQHGVTVVGDDAQSIYGFRAATVRNILDFPSHFDPPAQVVTLEQNYRSTQPVLAAANAVIGLARERYRKNLYSNKRSEQRPRLVAVEDENAQALYVAEQVLATRESGVALKRQAVLFRTAHHSDLLEVELSRRNIPFVKFGGLKFLEAAHVKDLLSVLRWVQNPRDSVAAFRVLQMLPGVGPATAQSLLETIDGANGDWRTLRQARVPAATQADWPGLMQLFEDLADRSGWPADVGRARVWYEPYLETIYDSPGVRAGDLEQMETLAGQYPTRERFLTELTLDPPAATGDHAVPPHLDEDYLILSTIHSAQGQEWDSVFILNVVDGCIPSDMSTGTPEEIEEERRLLYVAMTRAERELHLVYPLRFYVIQQRRMGGRHVYAPLSRFLPPGIQDRFERYAAGDAQPLDEAAALRGVRVDVAAKLRDMW